MKHFSPFHLLSILMVVMISIQTTRGQLVLYEDFDYTTPPYIGGNGNSGSSSNNWTTHSVTAGQTTTIDVVSGNLSYPGLATPSGSKVSMFGNGNQTSRDINRAITATGNVQYFSVLLKVMDNAGLTTTGDYFMHFGATAGNSVSIFGARLGAKAVNAGANYRYMILNTAGGSTSFTEFPQDLSFGTTYLVVVKYDRSTAPTTAWLWVNPVSLGGAEPSGFVMNNSGTNTFNTFASICLRNNATTPKLEIDEIRIGSTWAVVTPTGVSNPPTIQASDITFSSITAISMTTAWTNGDGARRIVKINTVNAFTNPADGTDPTANPTYAGSGEQVVYNGNGSSVNIDGLTGNTTYWYRVYEYNGTGSGTKYLTVTATGNPNSQATSSYTPPTVTTAPVTNISYTTATGGGDVLADGGFPVIARGVCYSTTPGPTLANSFTLEPGTLGPFTSNMTGLTPGTTYYVRAYATSTVVTGYGNEVNFTTSSLTAPAVITGNTTGITHTSAIASGNVTSGGGSPISARGICYSTSPNPTISGPKTVEPGTTGPFTSNLTGLLPQTTYHVRAYATNNTGTSYGADSVFTTLCEPYPPVTNFYASQTNILVGESVNYFDSTIYCPTQWNWSFVGGIPYASNVQNPVNIVYNYPGVYNTCLTTTNAYGNHTICKAGYITVNPPLNARIVMTEIMYNPPESGTDSIEYIELYNNDSVAINLEGFYFDAGIVFTFPSYQLEPYSYVIVAVNADAFYRTFDMVPLQWTSGALSNNGELLLLKDRYGMVVDSVYYDDVAPWDSLADGFGPSLELCNPDADNALGENWRAAIEFAAINTAGDTIWATPMAGCTDLPLAAFSASDTIILKGESVIFTDESTGPVQTWDWSFDGGMPPAHSGQTPPPVLYNELGVYDVSLTVSNVSGSHILVKEGYIEVGSTFILPVAKANTVTIYPNPTYGDFTVILPKAGKYHTQLLSPEGKLISERKGIEETVTFDISGFTPGIYLVRITNLLNGNVYLQRIVCK